jgi:exopolysaccharide biosynthesis predicted pyruvyltransferase EpsI
VNSDMSHENSASGFVVGSQRGNPKITMVASVRVWELFCALRNNRFLIVEPGGNFGDQLIYLGAEMLASRAGIQFRSLRYQEFVATAPAPDEVIYIHGGGGCVPWWSGTPISALRHAVKVHSGVTILGPQTFWTGRDFLRGIFGGIRRPTSERVILFTREFVSWGAVQEYAPSWAEVLVDHDTALNLSAGDLDAPMGARHGELRIVRNDKEALSDGIAPSFGVDPASMCSTFKEWLTMHSSAATIRTDRLHSSIVAHVLGIPVTLSPNNYFKNRAVWEFSLRTRGVTWADGLLSDLPALMACAVRGGFTPGN